MPRGGPRPGGFTKGHKINQGRTKASREKVELEKAPKGKFRENLVAMIEEALMKNGGVKYLKDLPPKELVALLGRIVPKDINLQATSNLNISINLSHFKPPEGPMAIPGQSEQALIEQAMKDHQVIDTTIATEEVG